METLRIKGQSKKACTLKEQLEAAFGSRFDFHPDFYNDFESLIIGSGSEQKIIKQFLGRLAMIIELGDKDFGLKWLERLKNYDNMYSLHLDADSKNYRLLFSKNKNGKLFLHMFYEKAGKRATSYDKHVPIALSRRNTDC